MKTNAKKTWVALTGATVALSAPLFAQATNAGAAEIITAVNGFKPDVSLIVVAGVAISIIVIGATLALAVAKRLMK